MYLLGRFLDGSARGQIEIKVHSTNILLKFFQCFRGTDFVQDGYLFDRIPRGYPKMYCAIKLKAFILSASRYRVIFTDMT